MKLFCLLFITSLCFLCSCKKTPSSKCRCDHTIDGTPSSFYEMDVSDCAECARYSESYTTPDEEFSTLEHQHVISCYCQ